MIIQSKRIWINGRFSEAQLEIEEGIITRILEYGRKRTDKDYGNLRIVPGFIDIHTHGAYGFETNSADEEGLRRWLRGVPKEGVTSILPATVTDQEAVLLPALRNIRKVVETGYEGADILGIHLEGPYISKAYAGGQPNTHIAKPDIAQFDRLQKEAGNRIKIITMATEEDPDFALTRYCHKQGIVVSIGHSAADFRQCELALANGATSMTHVFNALTPIHHRKLGGSGAALRYQDVYGEIICDGNHVSVDTLQYFFRLKGSCRGIMITDSLALKGLPVGTCAKSGSYDVKLHADGSARIKGTQAFAGSTLRMIDGLKLLVEKAMVPFETALNSCTINPARLLREDNHLGRLMVNYDADLVVLHDDYTIAMTYIKGMEAF